MPMTPCKKNPFSALAIGILLAALPAHAEQVTVETTDCNGDKGFVNFEDHRMYKIIEGNCENPDEPGTMLKQILLQGGAAGGGSYDVLSVTQQEAKIVMDQIRRNRDIRQTGRLRREHDITIRNTTDNTAPQASSSPVTPVVPVPVPQDDPPAQ
jgi:hypothetical protein